MIIVSLLESNYLQLEKSLKEAKQKSNFIEVRLDALKAFDLKKIKTIESQYHPIWTFRSKAEGGASSCTPNERKTRLKELISIKPRSIDLEFKRDKSLFKELKKVSPSTQCVLSWHVLKSRPSRYLESLKKMSQYEPWKVKGAFYLKSTCEALELLLEMKKEPKWTLMGLGPYASPTRILPATVTQPVIYTALNESKKTAHGQMSYDELIELYRIHTLSNQTKLYGLIGDPLEQSPGARVYNKLFQKLKWDALYLNVHLTANELHYGLKLLEQLGFKGLSVTIPHKESVARILKHKTHQAVNTLVLTPNGYRAYNTDQLAAIELIKPQKNTKILLMGAGGTAKAFIEAFKNLKVDWLFCNRTPHKAMSLARRYCGRAIDLKDLHRLKAHDYDILVQTTSYGTQKSEGSLIPKSILYPKKIILDVVLKQTKLIMDAKSKDCTVYTGNDFWVKQGLEQLRLWFKKLPKNTELIMKELLL